ncbi:hypothetical protein HNR46_002242 [Haloferula luteola]|uniref:Uncharacterized protein n=1 Tax=Haloferula luteola TaxID=595692 RepID=A0A840VGU3_9BACT|nr:hypothetical protein [Haloferula luteola]MBB5352001.1 hypothetical protein [Haloferula luteola]
MTEDSSEMPTPEVGDAPKAAKKAVRKSSRKRAAKKAPKKIEEAEGSAPAAEAVPVERAETPAASPKPEFSEVRREPSSESAENFSDSDDRGDRIPVMEEPAGGSDEHGSGKRRRRRRRRGGSGGEERGEERTHPPQRPTLDPEQVAKKAWKIFLAEVSEEGLALINDNDARELSRRSFRLAELFLEEASKHH